MRKGIILEINELYLTLLTPEGEFLRARKLQQDYQVGEEIHFFPETEIVKRRKFNLSFINNMKARAVALSLAFLLVFTASLPLYQSSQVYAYMSIDVNPSVELAVNNDLKVLRLKGYNEEGKQIIQAVSGWEKQDAALVAEMILLEMEQEGYLKTRNDVVIATVHKGKVKDKIEKKLEQKISEIKQVTEEEEVVVHIYSGTTEDREEAKELGVTTGVYISKLDKEVNENKPSDHQKPRAANQKQTNSVQRPVEKPANTDNSKPGKQEAPGQVKKAQSDNAANRTNQMGPEKKKSDPPANGKEQVKREDKSQPPSSGNNKASSVKNNGQQKQENRIQNSKRQQIRQDDNGHIGNGNANNGNGNGNSNGNSVGIDKGNSNGNDNGKNDKK
ncbi:anti-sigma factor domain-containing protein [Mesobacillus subterraneus]|uniref:Anti-sigma factor domain-containing protein n=1 Tax=Mesobacillus subterraneus TaxID=285983 RepID=A0A427TV36_9BACI|nr:anti-sigma factor domain-containing protein [Mesobacillus subterraneus]RSD28249.1 anti-sigma factor domain-containing protein [Mesobacillus subterraneus]